MKIVVSLNSPGDKGEVIAKRLAEFLDLDRQDILILPAGVFIHPVPTEAQKATNEGEDS